MLAFILVTVGVPGAQVLGRAHFLGSPHGRVLGLKQLAERDRPFGAVGQLVHDELRQLIEALAHRLQFGEKVFVGEVGLPDRPGRQRLRFGRLYTRPADGAREP